MIPIDLRIGNYVEATNNNVKFPYIVTAQELLYFNNDPNRFRPIRLTEELMVKFKFERCGYDHLSWKHKDMNEFEFSGLNWVERDILEYQYLTVEINGNLIDIHYVHQLQNLYFVLTGKELSI